MKNIICVFIVLFLITFTYGQDPIKNYPGIPIISDMGFEMRWAPPVEQFHKAYTAGICAFAMRDLTTEVCSTRIIPTNLLVIPAQYDTSLLNHIATYTDARYTVFEAEGTPPQDGFITLYNNDTLNLFVGNGAVSTTSLTEHGTMIYGPMYRQCRNFFIMIDDTFRSFPIVYQAQFWLKVEDLPNQFSSPEDTVCIIQVTTTKTFRDSMIIHNSDTLYIPIWDSTHAPMVLKDSVLTYANFIDSIGRFIDYILEYSFTHDIPWWGPAITNGTSAVHKGSTNKLSGKISQNCVEFKVLWKGKKDKIRFSVDKVVVSDWRGRQLKDPFQYPFVAQQISNQIDENKTDFVQRVAAFIGVDEPWSIDQWEPIRMVNEIINNYLNNKRSLAVTNEYKESQVDNQRDN